MSFHGDFHKHCTHLLQRLQVCSRIRSLDTVKPLHALAITIGSTPTQSSFICNNILSIYASLKHFTVAFKVFDNMPHRSTVSYNSIISACNKCDYTEKAWYSFLEMMGNGFRPNQFTLAGLLSCESMDVRCGVQLHALGIKNGLFYADAFVGTSLLGLFGRCGWLDEAVHVFEDMPNKSLVTWNSIITLFGHQGFAVDCMLLFVELVRENISFSECSFIGVLSGIMHVHDLVLGEQIHCLITKIGFNCKVSVVNSLVNMYSKCAKIDVVEKLIGEMVIKDIVTWNTIIGALAKSEMPRKALECFLKMNEDGIIVNETTFIGLIKACTILLIPMSGEAFHGKAIINGFETDVYLGSALVDYYVKCDKLGDAYCSFLEINEKNVVPWNALILGYANKFSSASIYLLIEMLQSGYRPNEFSFSSVLKSSLLLELQQLHCLIVKMGYEDNEYVKSSLIKSYGQNGLISDALIFVTAYEKPLSVVPSNIVAGIYNRSGYYHDTLKLLSQLEEPDSVSWNIIMTARSRSGNYKGVFELFEYMLMAHVSPDCYTHVNLLNICGKLCDHSLGSSVHGFIIKNNSGFCDVFVQNMLIDMYGKCGNIQSSVKIFNDMRGKNLITWTILISALGINGHAIEALERFKEMEFLGFRPDKVAFMSMLAACKHGGLVTQGIELFEKMHSYQIDPDQDHYHCIVDLLAKHGYLKEAEKVICSMPFPPNSLIWRSLVEGYGTGRIVNQVQGEVSS